MIEVLFAVKLKKGLIYLRTTTCCKTTREGATPAVHPPMSQNNINNLRFTLDPPFYSPQTFFCLVTGRRPDPVIVPTTLRAGRSQSLTTASANPRTTASANPRTHDCFYKLLPSELPSTSQQTASLSSKRHRHVLPLRPNDLPPTGGRRS